MLTVSKGIFDKIASLDSYANQLHRLLLAYNYRLDILNNFIDSRLPKNVRPVSTHAPSQAETDDDKKGENVSQTEKEFIKEQMDDFHARNRSQTEGEAS